MLKRLLILVILICFTQTAYGATFVQTIQTTVPAAVNVTAINPSLAQGTINAQTGISSSPAASFRLQTNGADTNYDYVVTANVLATGGTNVNAYAQISTQPYIILGNNSPTLYPTTAATNNIKGGSPTAANNANAIAYPITNTLTNLSSATLTTNATYGGLCFIVKTGTSRNGTIVQTVGASPLANTYSFLNDTAGVYQAVVTFSANRKP